MPRKLMWMMVSGLIVASLLVASCAAPTEEEVVEEEEEEWVSEIEEEEEVEEVSLVASKEPLYGGTITVAPGIGAGFDPVSGPATGQQDVDQLCMDRTGTGDWGKGPGGTNECPWMSPMYTALDCGKGQIIESVEQTGPLTYVGHVRPGIKFNACLPHIKAIVNDREVVADDIYYVWDRALNYPGIRVGMAEYIEAINVVDRYTIEFVMSKPFYDPIGALFYGTKIYPHEVIDEYGGIDDWRNLAGSGPFILTDYVTDSAATFKKNPDYWRYDDLNPENRLPYVDTYRQLAIDDRMTQLSAMRTGKIDIMWRVVPDEAITFEVSNPELLRRKALQEDSRPMFHIRCDEPPFDDVSIRRALVMAIDFQDIVDSYYGGEGSALTHVQCELWPDWYTPLEELPEDIQEIWGHSPDKARELLDDALGPGASLEFNINTPGFLVDEVLIFQEAWNTIGLEANVNTMEGGVLNSQLKAGEYHGISAWNGVIRNPYPGAIQPQDYNPGENFEDPIWEAMREEMMITTDLAEQRVLYEQARNHLLRNPIHIRFPHPYIYTYWQPWIGGYRGEFSPGAWTDLYASIWCDTAVKKAMGR